MRHFNLRSLSIIGLAALLAACPDKDPKSDPEPTPSRRCNGGDVVWLVGILGLIGDGDSLAIAL